MYTSSQIKAVRELQILLEVPGVLSDEDCRAFLDWDSATCSPSARGITSVAEAMAAGRKDGLTIHEMQFRKLCELAK